MGQGRRFLLEHVRRVSSLVDAAHWTDTDLLRAFAGGGTDGAAAFEAILLRHGPMVYRVCRAALPRADADDAFQATFLVLVRRAPSLTLRRALGPWLFGVARKVCGRVRRTAIASPVLQPSDVLAAVPAPSLTTEQSEAAALVHREVDRLPASLRRVVVLCDLEGLTYEAAGAQLGLGHATIRGRLARARERLRRRLARCGYGLPGALPMLTVPRALVRATAGAARIVVGHERGLVAESVLALVNGGVGYMVQAKLKSLGLMAMASGVLIAGAVGLSGQTRTSFADDTGNRGTGTTPVRTTAVDPADAILALVAEAQRVRGTNPEAAAAKVRQVESLARDWRAILQDEAKKRDADDRAAVNANNAKLARDEAAAGLRGQLNKNDPAGGDLEKRVRSLEEKLDRILKALETSGRNGTGELPGTGLQRR